MTTIEDVIKFLDAILEHKETEVPAVVEYAEYFKLCLQENAAICSPNALLSSVWVPIQYIWLIVGSSDASANKGFSQQTITDRHVTILKAFLLFRWKCVRDTERSYLNASATSAVMDLNQIYNDFARRLFYQYQSGNQIGAVNFYELLVPHQNATDADPATGNELTDYLLTDKQELLPIKSIWSEYDKRNSFEEQPSYELSITVGGGQRPLSPRELTHMADFSPELYRRRYQRFQQEALMVRKIIAEKNISITTQKVLKKFIEQIAFGVSDEGTKPGLKLKKVLKAFSRFKAYLEKLTPLQKQMLYAQQIYYAQNNKGISFGEVWNRFDSYISNYYNVVNSLETGDFKGQDRKVYEKLHKKNIKSVNEIADFFAKRAIKLLYDYDKEITFVTTAANNYVHQNRNQWESVAETSSRSVCDDKASLAKDSAASAKLKLLVLQNFLTNIETASGHYSVSTSVKLVILKSIREGLTEDSRDKYIEGFGAVLHVVAENLRAKNSVAAEEQFFKDVISEQFFVRYARGINIIDPDIVVAKVLLLIKQKGTPDKKLLKRLCQDLLSYAAQSNDENVDTEYAQLLYGLNVMQRINDFAEQIQPKSRPTRQLVNTLTSFIEVSNTDNLHTLDTSKMDDLTLELAQDVIAQASKDSKLVKKPTKQSFGLPFFTGITFGRRRPRKPVVGPPVQQQQPASFSGPTVSTLS